MADYIAQNREILDEVSAIARPLRVDGKDVGASDKMCFVASGTFQSPSHGLIYAGLKMPLSGDFTDQNVDGFYRALTNMALIHQAHPEIANQLPLFYGLLVDPSNKPRAIITQDFSEGAQHEVRDYRNVPHANIPDGLVDLFDPFGRDMLQLERALFYVNGERKIGDLDHLFPKEKYKQDWDKVRAEVASSNPVVNFTRVPLEELLPDETERRYANLVLEACQDGPKNHTDVIHADQTYRINLSTTINRVLDSLVDNWYLKMWRDEEHPAQQKMFALP